MFVAMSRLRVREGQEEMTAEAFRNRPGLVDNHRGFIRMEVLSPLECTNEFWLVTVWQDRTSFESWHRHHLNESHSYMPRGLKIEPNSRALQYFEPVCE